MKPRPHSQTRRGSAVVIMLVILSILGIYVVANAKRLHQLEQELKIIERRQLERYSPAPANPPATKPIPAP